MILIHQSRHIFFKFYVPEYDFNKEIFMGLGYQKKYIYIYLIYEFNEDACMILIYQSIHIWFQI